jgi:hypothetical protein
MDMMRMMYANANPDAYVGLEIHGPLKDGGESPRYLATVQVRDLDEQLPFMFDHPVLGARTQYVCSNTYTDKALVSRKDVTTSRATEHARELCPSRRGHSASQGGA